MSKIDFIGKNIRIIFNINAKSLQKLTVKILLAGWPRHRKQRV
jgi:hypothetical protein